MVKKVSEEVSANDEKSSEDSLDEDSAPEITKVSKLEVDQEFISGDSEWEGENLMK